MKVVQINIVCGKGSTGHICLGISKSLNAENIENYIIYCSENSNYPQAIKCSQKLFRLQALKSRFGGNFGFNSENITRKIIRELDKIRPDVVHLHNIHGHNCNLKILMDYFKTKQTKLVWTFHDCWASTAYCPHFIMSNCQQWKTECHKCPQIRTFSWFFDRSRWLFHRKQAACSDLDLTITTPSQWLADLVQESFLSHYPIKVINNGIDTSVFCPAPSDFREKHGISPDKFLILGVAIQWVPRKGADAIIRLANRLDPDKFQIVLVGTDDQVDKLLPDNIISIHRTQNQTELAEIYTAADLFINPTREEVFGLVNVEANACGTPVLTYRTGGSPECIDETSGIVVDCDDEEALYNAIIEIEKTRPFSAKACRQRALGFTEGDRYKEFIDLYHSILSV